MFVPFSRQHFLFALTFYRFNDNKLLIFWEREKIDRQQKGGERPPLGVLYRIEFAELFGQPQALRPVAQIHSLELYLSTTGWTGYDFGTTIHKQPAQ